MCFSWKALFHGKHFFHGAAADFVVFAVFDVAIVCFLCDVASVADNLDTFWHPAEAGRPPRLKLLPDVDRLAFFHGTPLWL